MPGYGSFPSVINNTPNDQTSDLILSIPKVYPTGAVHLTSLVPSSTVQYLLPSRCWAK